MARIDRQASAIRVDRLVEAPIGRQPHAQVVLRIRLELIRRKLHEPSQTCHRLLRAAT